jgi:low affinity Fe/Cu permease
VTKHDKKPSKIKTGKSRSVFDRLATAAVKVTGSSGVFIAALFGVLIWGLSGPFFHYSETWQLVINTSTTIITFLMVFLIQHAQNKDSLAIHLKLNELIASQKGASNRLIAGEELDEDDLEQLRLYYEKLAHLAAEARDLTSSHSVEEARRRHEGKLER